MAPCDIKHLLKQKIGNRLDPEFLNKNNHWQGLFSMELSDPGQRYFFVLKYDLMFKLYNYYSEYHFYEVIPENYPCHLYFDVEYLFEEHKDFNGDKLIEDLVSLVDEKLFLVFGRTDYELIDLEATTEKKFSRHLIFHSDKFMFRNNMHVGHFVQTEILTNPEFAQIVDPAVYSKNRNFRLIWCTKLANGTKYPLVPKDKTNSKHDLSSLEYFLKTLISYKPTTDPHLIGYPEIVDQKKIKAIQIKSSSNAPTAGPNSSSTTVGSKTDEKDLETFAIKSFAPTGRISHMTYSPEFDTISLFVEGNRFCQNIGREHKSNHIYLICNLTRGSISQRCFDPDCRGYESPPVDIPVELLQSLRSKYLPSSSDLSEFVPQKVSKISSIEKIINENFSFLSDCDDDEEYVI